MNLKLLKKLCRRFAKLKAGEKPDGDDQLTSQELRDCRHMIERFHCYGDKSSFDALAALAMADIYGSLGKLDIFIEDLIQRIKGDDTDKPAFQLVLGLLKTLPQDIKYLKNLAELWQPDPTTLSPKQQGQRAALQVYTGMLGGQGKALLDILEEVVKTGVTEGLIGHQAVSDPQYEPETLVQWASELECTKTALALMNLWGKTVFLPTALADLLVKLLMDKNYKAARFLINLKLPCRLTFKISLLSEFLIGQLRKDRQEGLIIMLDAFPIIDVLAGGFIKPSTCILTLNSLNKNAYGQWNACGVLIANPHVKTGNGMVLFENSDEALRLLKGMYETRLLNIASFEPCSIAEQYNLVKAIVEAPDNIYGPEPYDRLCLELKSYPKLCQIFCKRFNFEGSKLLLRHAAGTNDISCLSAIDFEEIWAVIVDNIDSRTPDLLNAWPTEENIDVMMEGILFAAMMNGSLDFLALIEAKAGFKGLSPLEALRVLIQQRPVAKGWAVLLNFLTSSVGKPAIQFLLERGFIEMTDLSPEIQSALKTDMSPEDYALHFLLGDAAWRDCGLPKIHGFMTASSRCGFNAVVYHQLCILCNGAAVLAGEEIDEEILEQAFKLSILFGTAERAWAFIEKYAEKGERWPIHRLCQFDLPEMGFWQPREWGDFALLHGLEAARWVVFAPSFERAGLGVPQDLQAAQTFVVTRIYGVEVGDPVKLQEFANLCAAYRLAPEAFAACKALIDKGLKTSDLLPDIFISGQDIGVPGYYLMRLPCGDLRGFLLGKITNCCQYVGAQGGSCAISGMTDQNSGFYVVCKMAGTAPSPQDQIVAQLWAWIGENDYLVFDSWERLRGENDWMCRRFLSAMRDIVNPGPLSGIKGFYIGGGGNTPKYLCYARTYIPDTHPDADIYSDADKKQLIIYGRDKSEKEEREYLRKKARDFDLEESAVYFLFKESSREDGNWMANIANLLKSQRGVTNVEHAVHSTSQGGALFSLKADIENWIYLEISESMKFGAKK